MKNILTIIMLRFSFEIFKYLIHIYILVLLMLLFHIYLCFNLYELMNILYLKDTFIYIFPEYSTNSLHLKSLFEYKLK